MCKKKWTHAKSVLRSINLGIIWKGSKKSAEFFKFKSLLPLFNNPNFEASPKIAYQILAVQDISVVPTIKEGKKIPSDLFGLEQNKQNDNSAHALKNINY